MSRLSGEVFSILLAFIVATSLSFAQTYTNWTLNGNVVNNGTIRVNRNIINNTTGLVTVSGTGVVKLQGNTAGSHAIRCTNIADTYPVSIIRLDLIGVRVTTLNTPTLVPTQLRIGDGTTTYTAASPGFTIGAQTLTIGDVSTYMATSTALLTFSGGTVIFNGAAAQLILNNAAGVTYGILSLTGAGAKSVTTGGTVTAATVTQTLGSGQLSVTENVDVTGTGSFTDIGAISATKKLRFTATATSGSVTSMNNSSTGTFENASNGTVTITTLAGNTGTINQSGATGTLTFTNAAVNNGTGIITNTSTGTITFANNLTGTGTVSQTANGTINVGGSFTQNTYTLATFGTVVYNGTAAQSVIGGITYNNLTIATTSGNATASAALTLTGNLVINSGSTLDMAGFTTSTFPGGSNNNAGTIKWSGSNVYVSGAGTTEFYSAAVGNVATGANYGILLFSGTGMKTFTTSPVTATGTMTVNSGAQVTVNNGVTVQVNGSTNISGNVTNNGAVNVGP
jgi:fibronectin-binding autotransporter adhesin